MGFLEPHVGHRSGDGETRLRPHDRAITICSLSQTEAALNAATELGVPVTILSVPDAAAAVGPAWFNAVIRAACERAPEVPVTAILDCGDAPGYALAAIRHGIKAIRYNGSASGAIAAIAAQAGAVLIESRPPSLDLNAVEESGGNLTTACRAWLQKDS